MDINALGLEQAPTRSKDIAATSIPIFTMQIPQPKYKASNSLQAFQIKFLQQSQLLRQVAWLDNQQPKLKLLRKTITKSINICNRILRGEPHLDLWMSQYLFCLARPLTDMKRNFLFEPSYGERELLDKTAYL